MANEKPIHAGLIAALTGKLRQTAEIWFGPSAPPLQVAPATNPVRSFDYPVGVNIQFAPRADEPVTFEQMRNLADEYYLLRIVIETVKDRICAKPWQFRVRGAGTAQRLKPPHNSFQRTAEAVLFYGGANGHMERGTPVLHSSNPKPGSPGTPVLHPNNRKSAQPRAVVPHDPMPAASRVERLTEFFRMPNGEHTWQKWMRALLEDLLVIDAATLYPQRTKGGEIARLVVVDGATIKRVIDPMGLTPMPPAVAYQQVIKGVLAKDLTRDDLIYMPRNVRPHKIYGYSPVEQVILIVNLAIRRTVHQLNYYTEGNVPEGFGFLPKDWNGEQIATFDRWFQSVTNGDLAERRRIQWIPETTRPIQFSKTAELFDKGEEWLARVIAFAFSLSPSAFVHQMNRATAEQSQDTAEEEGEVPIMNWVKDEINAIVQSPAFFNEPEIEFVWSDQPDVDALKQAQIDEIYLRTGVRTVNEIRERDGLEAIQFTEN